MTPSLSLVMLDTTVLMWEGSKETGRAALFFQQAVNKLGIFNGIYKGLSSQKKESCDLGSGELENGKLPEYGGRNKQAQCVFDELSIENQKKIAVEVIDFRKASMSKPLDQGAFKAGWQARINLLRDIIENMEY